MDLNEILFLTPKNDPVIGKPFWNKGFALESIYKNDHYSERKFKILSLLNKEHILFAFNKELIKKHNKIILSECAQISTVARYIYIYIYNRQADINAYFWNILEGNYINEVEKLQKMGVETYTFDIGDCQKYNMKYKPQPYPYLEDVYLGVPDIKYSCYFCAADKGRLSNLLKIKEVLEKQNIPFYFKVLKEKHKKYYAINGIEFLDELIDYNRVLKETNSADCIVELLTKGQKGYTLRTMEALFLNKKLITDNLNIRFAEFYHPNNIFILDKNYEDIKDFLSLPKQPIPEHIKEKYSCKTWIRSFFEV